MIETVKFTNLYRKPAENEHNYMKPTKLREKISIDKYTQMTKNLLTDGY